ncbi:MAG: dephospho-CoA kinase [Rhodoglobus sp.]
MHLIALTGGIASGKSTVARRWQQHGAVIVDADALAREVVEPGSAVLQQIGERFGPEVIAADGSLDRAALGAMVFADDDAEARHALDSITHPAIAALAQSRIDSAVRADPNALIVYDIPLLVESGQPLERFFLVVTVEAEAQTRVQRLVTLRGMDPASARHRVAAQASASQRLAVADLVIDANESPEATDRYADEVWGEITARVQASL